MSASWHVGRTVGVTLYSGDGPDDLVGVMVGEHGEACDLAERVVWAVNRMAELTTEKTVPLALDDAKSLLYMLQEHERIANMVKATPWFIAPMSRPMRALEVAIITAITATEQ